MPPSLIREAAEYFERAAVTRVYGSTEVPVTTIGVTDRGDVSHAAETDGQVGIATVKLADADGATAGTGEVLAQGPQMLVGYVHPEDEATVFDDQGYYRTGDLGRWIDDTYLVIVGRSKDIIISGAENISSIEVEDVLHRHPDVLAAAVVARPDPKWGEVPVAYVELRAGASATAEQIVEHCRGLLARYKVPKEIRFEPIPKTSTGKIQKFQLRERAKSSSAIE